jgi:hypothetical protein
MARPDPNLNELQSQTGIVAMNVIAALAVYRDDFDKLADFLDVNCNDHAPGSEGAQWHDRANEMFRLCGRIARDNHGLMDMMLNDPKVRPEQFLAQRAEAEAKSAKRNQTGVMLEFKGKGKGK